VDGLRRPVQLAQLVGIGVDVDQRLARHRDLQQFVALGGHFRQPPAQQHDEIGGTDARQ
jgi:hypothetical protein